MIITNLSESKELNKELYAKLDKLEKTYNADLDKKDAEIVRLNTVIGILEAAAKRYVSLITELCDALDRCDPIQISIQEMADLIQLAREATR